MRTRVVLYQREKLECLGPDDEPVETLWVSTSGQVRVVSSEVVVGICYNVIRKKK